MPNSIPISWPYILIVCIRVCSSFSSFANSLGNFYVCDWVASLLLHIVIVKVYLHGRCLWIFTSADVFYPVVNFTFQFFPGFPGELYDFVGYLALFKAVYYPALRHNVIALFVVNPRHTYIFPARFVLLEGLSVLRETVCSSLTSYRSTP